MKELDEFREHVLKLDHTAHAVRSIAEAARLYRDVLGGLQVTEGVNSADGFRYAQFRYPNGAKIELLEPTDDTGFVARFIQERGEGLHHLTFTVEGLEALVEKLKARGYRIVGERYGNPAWKEAFISPRHAHGTIVQLAESTHSVPDAPSST